MHRRRRVELRRRDRVTRRVLEIAAVVAALVLLALFGREIATRVTSFAGWVQGLGAWGPLVFVAGYAVATVAMVPGSLLTLAAGVVYGPLLGGMFVLVGASVGAALAFLVGRHLARGWVERRLAADRRFAAIDSAIADDGLRIVFLLRLSPLFPFNLLNYALGLTRVPFKEYLLASFGMIPGIALYVYAGHLAGDLARAAAGAVERGTAYYVVMALGFVATVAVTVLVTRRARAALRSVTR